MTFIVWCKYILHKNRPTSKVWGQIKPISDNKSEDGKTKNIRVEIVKL